MPVRFNELDGFLEFFRRDVGEILADFLGWRVIDFPARKALPTNDPNPAKAAVSVKDEKWSLQT